MLPHPKKSKEASENPVGKKGNNPLLSSFEEELPCKYKIILLFLFVGQNIDKYKCLSLLYMIVY